MHILSIFSRLGGQSSYYISSPESAEAAYAKLNAAMANFLPFKNDRQEIVTFETACGQATYKVEELYGVHLEDCAKSEGEIIERAVMARTIKARVEARLAPAA